MCKVLWAQLVLAEQALLKEIWASAFRVELVLATPRHLKGAIQYRSTLVCSPRCLPCRTPIRKTQGRLDQKIYRLEYLGARYLGGPKFQKGQT